MSMTGTETAPCQAPYMREVAEPLGRVSRALQLRLRAQRVLRRRLVYLRNRLERATGRMPAQTKAKPGASNGHLQAGDRVRVRSKEEVQATLDNWNYLKGCGFMSEMWRFCGTEQTVRRPVRRFLDERDNHVKKCSGIVLLENVICDGTVDYGACDRSCFFFWREEWLEKLG